MSRSTSAASMLTETTAEVTTSDEVDSMVRRSWKHVKPGHVGTQPEIMQRVVRVFVSSTFVDMHSEREALTKQVFPSLRDWCSQHSLSLAEVDLRWGVPIGSQSETTIGTCLLEIDRCIQSNHQPFFVSLLGHRYGWIPDLSELQADYSEHLKQTYKWIDNVSITHMEIMHGAYRRNNPNAIFMMRDGHSYDEITDKETIDSIVDKKELPVRQMKELKNRLKREFPSQCHRYSAKPIGVENQRILFSGLRGDKFTGVVLDFLKQAITRHYQLDKHQYNELNSMEQEQISQAFEAIQHRQHFIGRVNELDMLHACCTRYSKHVGSADELPDEHSPDSIALRKLSLSDAFKSEHQYNRPIFWLTGQPGIGKTAIIANLITGLQKQFSPTCVFYHFCDAGSDARNLQHFMCRLLDWAGMADLIESDAEAMGRAVQSKMLSILRSKTRGHGATKFIIIDGLEKLSNCEATQHLDWLPARVPSNLTILVSSSDLHIPTTYRLKIRGPIKISLSGLNSDDQAKYAKQFLGHFGKKLDSKQMEALVTRQELCSPQWLSVALEELRVFGHFDRVTEMIERLPLDSEDLMLMVLKRIVSEDNDLQRCKHMLLYLCTVNNDMLDERAMSLLLGDVQDGVPAPAILMSTTRIALKQVVSVGHTGYYRINHQAKKVVLQNMLDEARIKFGHQQLADYFNLRHQNLHDVARHYPRHCIEAGNLNAAGRFLLKDNRSKTLGYYKDRSDCMKRLRCPKPVFPMQSYPLYVCRFCKSDTSKCVFCESHADVNCVHCSLHLQQPAAKCMFCTQPIGSNTQLGTAARMCRPCAGTGMQQCAAVMFKIS